MTTLSDSFALFALYAKATRPHTPALPTYAHARPRINPAHTNQHRHHPPAQKRLPCRTLPFGLFRHRVIARNPRDRPCVFLLRFCAEKGEPQDESRHTARIHALRRRPRVRSSDPTAIATPARIAARTSQKWNPPRPRLQRPPPQRMPSPGTSPSMSSSRLNSPSFASLAASLSRSWKRTSSAQRSRRESFRKRQRHSDLKWKNGR